MTHASPPGEPDTVDLERLTGWQPIDLEALKERQWYIAHRYRTALLTWSAMVAATLVLTIVSGDVLFLVAGYAVTLPFLFMCSKYKRAIDNAREFQAMCDLDDDFCE